MTWYPLLSQDTKETAYNYRKMPYQLTVSYNLEYGFLRCSLLSDTRDTDLNIRTLKGIHVYKNIASPKLVSTVFGEQRSDPILILRRKWQNA